MKALVCELCGGNELIKEDGLYRCVHCGTRYTVEEARGLFIDGPVQVEGIASSDNLLARARDFLKKGDVDQAEEYCNRVLDIDITDEAANALLKQVRQTVDKPNLLVKIKQTSDAFDSTNLFIDGEYITRVTTDAPVVLQLTVGKYKVGPSAKEWEWLEVTDRHERFLLYLRKRVLTSTLIDISRLQDDTKLD